jgi:predicted transglutaminase-like cysteine proteinase
VTVKTCRLWLAKTFQAVVALSFTARRRLIPSNELIGKKPHHIWIAQSKRYAVLLFCTALISTASVDEEKMLQVMQTRYGSEGTAILGAWQNLIRELDSVDQAEKIKGVNDFFNTNITYRDDVTLWRKSDYWATPLETLGIRAGDCEDFTIAKYLSLLRLGIPTQQLRLIYVKAQIGGANSKIFQAHMVLGYYPTTDAIPLILDSLITRIEPANKRSDLRPVFSFNSEGLWVGNTQAQVDPTARLSRWRDLLNRAQAEGMQFLDAAPSGSTTPHNH